MRATITIAAVMLLTAAATGVAVPHVTGIKAKYQNGQVFITWNNLTATGITYTVYKSVNHIVNAGSLATCDTAGNVGDSSAVNRRYSNLIDSTVAYIIKPGDPALALSKGLFVTTCTDNLDYYYAVTVTQSGTEYKQFNDGVNALADGSPVSETVADPQPVLQLAPYHAGDNTVSLYAQFLTRRSQPAYPAMTNAGSFPMNFAISVPSTSTGTAHALILRLHVGNGSYLDRVDAALPEDTWQLALDDWLPNADGRTGWFGYHANYNIFADTNTAPTSPGTVIVSYTLKRIMYSLDWTIAHCNIDANMVYLSGTSMGGAGAVIVAMLYPERFAAADLSVPKFNFAQLTDWQGDVLYDFSVTGNKRLETNRRWGRVDSNFITDVDNPVDPGTPLRIYEITDGNFMAALNHDRSLPIIFAVNGKRDDIVGWTEKIAYYQSMNDNLHGGFYYWDMREHTGGVKTWSNWEPSFRRYRNDLSYPAFSNCTISDSATDGIAAPQIGSRNGFLDWNDDITDEAGEWRDTLKYRSGLQWADSAAVPAATSCRADVTLRRTQSFHPDPGTHLKWRNYKGGIVIQHGTINYIGGPITVDTVLVYQSGNLLRIWDPTVMEPPGGGPELQ